MIEARKFSVSDFLVVAVAFGLLFTFFAETTDAGEFTIARAQEFTISRVRISPARPQARHRQGPRPNAAAD
jgi:hypothetical protein